MRLFLILLLIIFSVASCKELPDKSKNAFYYWKTRLELKEKDVDIANQFNIGHYFIRYFDVQYSEGYGKPVPLGILETDVYKGNYFVNRKTFTPVVFIDNNTFIKSTDAQLEELSDNIKRKVEEITSEILSYIDLDEAETEGMEWNEINKKQDSIRNIIQANLKEVQIDCDWTKTTSPRYFKFLQNLQVKYGDTIKVSCTLRLHQYKYRTETGIPPVSKVMLMCYNVEDIKSFSTKNSIFSEEVVKKYLIKERYPIALDIALPIFSWGIVFRNKKFIGILNNLDEKLVAADTNLIHVKDNLFQFKIDVEIGNTYVRAGDLLRLEQPNKTEIQNIISLLKRKVVSSQSKITFYHWDHDLIKNYNEDIQNYYHSFN